MNEKRLQQLRDEYKNEVLTKLIDAIVNLTEALIPDTKTGTDSWPPDGVVIEVSNDGDYWMPRISAGDGDYYDPNGDVVRMNRFKHWRYASAPWQNVSEDMQQWAVFSDGTTDWSNDADYWHVGDEETSGFATCIHVENRPEDV